MLSAMDSTFVRTVLMICIESSSALRPARPVSAACCAVSAMSLARCEACSAVCATSSTVATVSVTAAIDSLAPAACSVADARISAELDAITELASWRGARIVRVSSTAMRTPARSAASPPKTSSERVFDASDSPATDALSLRARATSIPRASASSTWPSSGIDCVLRIRSDSMAFPARSAAIDAREASSHSWSAANACCQVWRMASVCDWSWSREMVARAAVSALSRCVA